MGIYFSLLKHALGLGEREREKNIILSTKFQL